jgi:uncharacterized protein YjdB
MKNYLLLALAAVALCFTACKKDNPEPKPVAVTGVSLDKTMVALEIDESATVKAIIAPENATNKAVEWSIADTTVATVVNGVVTGVAVGETTLTATTADGGFTATIPVKVVAEKVSSITIGAQATKIGIGEVTYLNANLQPEHPDEDGIEWSSSNPGIATVEDSAVKHGAKVTGVAAGKATITATAKDGSGVKGSIEIEVVTVPTSITFDGKTSLEIYSWWGKEVDLKAKVTPEGVSLKELTWRWNDPNASSNPDGLKYNVTDDKATLTYTWPSATSSKRGVDVRAFYGDGSTVFAKANVYIQTFAWLLKYNGNTIDYKGLYALTDSFNFKYNWNIGTPKKLVFVAYYNSQGSADALPQYYKEYYIPTSEYTLTSSDSSKIKVTKNADGESWDLERVNTTDLAAVTLTNKCGNHTQTYTINLIP